MKENEDDDDDDDDREADYRGSIVAELVPAAHQRYHNHKMAATVARSSIDSAL